MTQATKTLPAPGSRVGVVCGPGESAKYNAGIVLCHNTDEWYTYAVVLMDSGKIQHCMGLTKVGIGWYAL
jgi:hypothetical protein